MRPGRRPASAAGRRGERIAAWYLRRRGYRVLARNLIAGRAEADLVCLSPDRACVVIVEVKSRRASHGERRPESQIGTRKADSLRRAAAALQASDRLRGLPVRIDVVAVDLSPWPLRSRVRHHERAVSR
jgi:putative endonuclease